MQEIMVQSETAIYPPATPTPAYRKKISEKFQKLSIIIPCYNEAATISSVLDKIAEVTLLYNIQKEIIIINDSSIDQTDQVIKEYILDNPTQDIHYFCHDVNRGKGAAIHSGIRYATGEFLLVQDADMEYDPSEYNILLGPILRGDADIVYGSRFMGGSPHRILFFWHSIGNRFLTFLSNVFSNLNLTDMETGYKLFRTSLIQRIPLQEKRFGFEPEVTGKIARIPGARIYEVGISYYGRTYKEGKKIKLKDGIWTVFCILKYSLFKRSSLTISKQEAPLLATSA